MPTSNKQPGTVIAGQTWNAAGYARHADFVPTLGVPVVSLLAAKPEEHILDLGCGDGILTAAIAETGAHVLGVDASPQLIAAAKKRGVDAKLMDGQKLTFREEFDAVFSNAALHWMKDWRGVLSGVHKALKPGGRFVGEFGGHGNVAAIASVLIAILHARGFDNIARLPWYFPTAEEYRTALTQHGFRVRTIELIPRPTLLPTGIRGWLTTFANPFLTGLAPEEQQSIIDETVSALAPSLCDRSGNWTADYVRLRFDARKENT